MVTNALSHVLVCYDTALLSHAGNNIRAFQTVPPHNRIRRLPSP